VLFGQPAVYSGPSRVRCAHKEIDGGLEGVPLLRLFLKGKGSQGSRRDIFRLRRAVLREEDQLRQAQPAHGAEIPFQFGPEGIMPPGEEGRIVDFSSGHRGISHILRGEDPAHLFGCISRQLRPRSRLLLEEGEGDGEHVPNRCPGLLSSCRGACPFYSGEGRKGCFHALFEGGSQVGALEFLQHPVEHQVEGVEEEVRCDEVCLEISGVPVVIRQVVDLEGIFLHGPWGVDIKALPYKG